MIQFRPRSHCGLLLLILPCAFGLAAGAHAFSIDTGPGSPTGGGASLYDDRPTTTGHQHLAARFSVDTADTISSVQGWMNWDGGRLGFSVWNDFEGLPGSPLHGVALLLPATATNVPDWRGVGGLDWDLAAGDYWLVFEDARGAGSGSMPGGATTPLAAYASSPGVLGTPWMRADTLALGVRINVFPEPPPAPIPLPNALLLAGSGLLTMQCGLRRRHGSRMRDEHTRSSRSTRASRAPPHVQGSERSPE